MTKHHHQKNEETSVSEETAEIREETKEAESVEQTVEEIDEVAAKTAELREEVEKLRDMYMRSQAETANCGNVIGFLYQKFGGRKNVFQK